MTRSFALILLVSLLIPAFSARLAAQTNAPAATPTGAPAAVPEPTTKTDRNGVVTTRDFVYGKGGDHDLHVDFSYPTKNVTGPLPAVIYIHGGGWIGGSKNEGAGAMASLVPKGYFVATIEYRLDNVAKWPAQLDDCKLAVRWLRANAAKYNVDPNHIGVWGSSAGGHLVACLGTMGEAKEYEGPGVSSAVQAVVDFFGPTDFTRAEIYSPKAIHLTEGLFGATYAEKPDLWKSGSPFYHVAAGDPPMLLVHGDADDLVPIAQSTVFDEALAKVGVPHQLLVVKNGGHGFSAKAGTTIDPDRAGIAKAVFEFFDKNLKATTPASTLAPAK